jgi:hypothetical protein
VKTQTNIMKLVLVAVLISGIAACTENRADPNAADKGGLLPSAKPEVTKIIIPEGTRLRITLIDGVSTTRSSPGDNFMASIADPVVVDGKTILEKGTRVRGRVTDVSESGRVKGRASIRLVLTNIVRNGKEIPISTRPFVAVAENTKKRDATIIGGGAGVGTLIGAIAGGKKGALVGAAVGAGAGTGTVLATKGKDLHYAPETRLTFTLANSLEI